MKGDGNVSDLNKLEQELTRLQQKKQEILEKQKQLERKLKEEERKARTRSLILFAEIIIKQLLQSEKEETLNLKIVDAQGKDYTPYFQKEVQRIREKLSQTQEQNQNQNQEGETHSFFVENQGSFTEQPNADL